MKYTDSFTKSVINIIKMFRNGDWSAQFSTERMAWAAIKGFILVLVEQIYVLDK